MKIYTYIIYVVAILFVIACNSRKSASVVLKSDMENVDDIDSLRTDTLCHTSPDEFEDGHMPPPLPDGHGFDGPPPRGKIHHQPNNMRGFDPASEDDMDDNGMSRYMENYDDEGWD